MSPTDDATDENGVDRRRVLKTIGAATAGLLAASGTAAAHEAQFEGCDRVCTGTEGSFAVVAVDGSFTCRPMTATSGVDVPWSWQSYCYEASADEAIVGLLEENVVRGGTTDSSGSCSLCVNPNDCAASAYDSVDDIVAALDQNDACGVCAGHVEAGGDCTTYAVDGDSGSDGSGGSDGDDTDGGSDGGDGDGSDETDGSETGDDSSDGDDPDGGGVDDGDEDDGDDGGGDDGGADDGDGSDDNNDDNDDGDDGGGDDYDTNQHYSDDRELWRSDLVDDGSDDGPAWECENTTENPTAMELWYDRDDTPVDPADRERCGSGTDEDDGLLTAMQRWLARDDTPDSLD
ncbi:MULTISPECIES: hypothetical protein [Halomicrobium]|uniref:Uncharacterized protein n=2 Tax=Halomicrobium mukohataei TaxID=57705 RepID=C7NXJ3_HALMD|nr:MULTISPECIES: hypothetical protein [Halomicrobium]ACV48427.1 hypothetical protein Hmuk_2315 [Halomicrobium mukohataei DSM 12286]QCD66834.1 hypothetical protein E5139_14710 [Halomicrobium mukohataei]QFR21644.1 hypothetical protein GBQ70_14725 [Halomicrobium sp. ZPS1]